MSDEFLPEWVKDHMLLTEARFDLVAERWARWLDVEEEDGD